MIPLVLFYSWLAGKLRRQWLLSFYAFVYALGGFLAAYFINDPTIGLANTVASGGRLFGWIFYLFLEGYSPFLVSVLWAFFNSISRPEQIKSRYVLITLCSKMGGVVGAGLAWLFMSKCSLDNYLSASHAHIYVLVVASTILLLVPLLMGYLMYAIPQSYLKGYSQIKEEEHKKAGEGKKMHDSGSGFMLVFKYPYVLGCFGMIFFWEMVNVIFNYMRLGVGLKEAGDSMIGFSAFLFKNAMVTHMMGVVIAILGTASLVRYLGERLSLILVPLFVGGAVVVCLMLENSSAIIFTYLLIRAINYAFFYPLREGLYIPTSDAIKFKAKSWIDSFGSKISKSFGSIYNKCIQFVPLAYLYSVQMGFFMGLIGCWTLLAYLMGKKWSESIEKNEVIGEGESL